MDSHRPELNRECAAVCNYCGCRALEPIAQLFAEHNEIQSLSAQIRRAVGAGDFALAADRLHVLQELLEIHDAVEELSLYPALARNLEFFDKVGTLSDEHDELDTVVRTAMSSAERTGPGTADWVDVLSALEMLAEHIDREENGVFPAAAVCLDPADWEHAAAVRAQRSSLGAEPAVQAVQGPRPG